jgi:hypothetical protein
MDMHYTKYAPLRCAIRYVLRDVSIFTIIPPSLSEERSSWRLVGFPTPSQRALTRFAHLSHTHKHRISHTLVALAGWTHKGGSKFVLMIFSLK